MRMVCSADFPRPSTDQAEKLFDLSNAPHCQILTSRVLPFINVDVIEIQFMTTLPLDLGRIRVQP